MQAMNEKPPRKIYTEIGAEKLCVECNEYWPLDDEFWFFQWATSVKGVKYKQYCAACKACYDTRYRPNKRVKERKAIRSIHEQRFK